MAWHIVFEPLLPVLLIAALSLPGIAALPHSPSRPGARAPRTPPPPAAPTRQAEISYAVFCSKKKNTLTSIY